MVVNAKKFPDELIKKICGGVKQRKVNIEFKDGANIIAEDNNIRFIEPYKVHFTSKRKNPTRYLIALIFDDKLTNKHTIFINDIPLQTPFLLLFILIEGRPLSKRKWDF